MEETQRSLDNGFQDLPPQLSSIQDAFLLRLNQQDKCFNRALQFSTLTLAKQCRKDFPGNLSLGSFQICGNLGIQRAKEDSSRLFELRGENFGFTCVPSPRVSRYMVDLDMQWMSTNGKHSHMQLRSRCRKLCTDESVLNYLAIRNCHIVHQPSLGLPIKCRCHSKKPLIANENAVKWLLESGIVSPHDSCLYVDSWNRQDVKSLREVSLCFCFLIVTLLLRCY
jgi:hypothetical protein